jgi:NADPH:quinone reductase-like Zn-dependent oxidoreductase
MRRLLFPMKAAWYERQGRARDVLVVGEMPDPAPGLGEVRIRVAVSGVNPGDVKKREDAFGVGMPYPRVVPHSDGAGTIDRVGEGTPHVRIVVAPIASQPGGENEDERGAIWEGTEGQGGGAVGAA